VNPPKATGTAVIYARASTDDQDTSCDQQVRECTDRAKKLGLTIDAVFKDDGISGARRDRPGYQQMLKAAEAKEFDNLLIWKQSRLGRDHPEVERAIRRLEFHGVRLVTCDGYDTSAGSRKNRKLTRGIKGIIDESFLDDLSEDTYRGQRDQYEKGYWLGGRVYGYSFVKVTSGEKDNFGELPRIGTLLKIDPTQSKIVTQIFERYANGESPQSIAADLNKREVPSPGSAWKNRKARRCKGWARSGIWVMLRNPLYAGTYLWSRSQWVKREQDPSLPVEQLKGPRARVERGQTEWLGAEGNKPEWAIIKAALWKRVQARLNANKNRTKDARLQSGGKAVYLLSGLLKCSKCGAHFVMDSTTHYRCGSVVDGKACSNRIRVRRDLAEQVVLQPIVDELLAPDMVDEMTKEMRAYYEKRMAANKAKHAKVPAEVQELDKRIARLQVRLKKGDPDLSSDDLGAALQKAEAKRAALLSAEPEAKRMDKVLQALPAAAAEYRRQIAKGLKGNRAEASRARLAVRKLLGDKITLAPAKGGNHLVAHLEFSRTALIAGSVGSGGRI
jgi:DNA invertase Pin-like site-specific DNA recombinase